MFATSRNTGSGHVKITSYRALSSLKVSLVLFLLSLSCRIYAQDAYWQQKLAYTIDVTLNDQDKTLTGAEKIVYKNNSPQTLDFIWFHIWANAYKDKNTALFQQLRKDREHKKKISTYQTGYVEGLQFKVNGQSAATEAHPVHIDVLKLKLPSPLKPGDSAVISTDFKVKLPSFYSRSGFSENGFMICQWYPKPAVFDKEGWHEFPYLNMGEFYSEYASYLVNITLPASYVVSATGVLQNAEELSQYKAIGRKNAENRKYGPVHYKPAGTGMKTLTYKTDSVPDFAWFASKDFIVQYDQMTLKSGRKVDAFTYYFDRENTPWTNSIDYVKDAVEQYSNWIGEYQYPVVQAVEGPKNNSSGGMEYPTVTLITSPDSKNESLDAVIAHEVGHNWFMSMIGSNERSHPWQDEGLNTYFQLRYEAIKYRSNSIFGNNIPPQLRKLSFEDFQERTYNVMASIPMKPAMDTPSEAFKNTNDYAVASYVKPALWVYRLQESIGIEGVNKAFRNYFNLWKFRHPTPRDMKAAFEQSAGFTLDAWFNLLYREGPL